MRGMRRWTRALHPPLSSKKAALHSPRLNGRARTAPLLSPLPTKTASLGFRGDPVGLAKENPPEGLLAAARLTLAGRARWKKKPLGPNLPVRASLGMRRLIASFPQICPAPSECAATRLATHAYAASCDVTSHSGVLVNAPCFSSRCRSRGWIPKEGAAAPSFWSFRKGVQGETQPKGFPPGLSLGATRKVNCPKGAREAPLEGFSRREKWVASAHLPRGVPPKERRAAPPAAPSFKTAPPGPAARRRRWCAAAGRSRSTAGRRWPFSG